jgi:hypothetical protein
VVDANVEQAATQDEKVRYSGSTGMSEGEGLIAEHATDEPEVKNNEVAMTEKSTEMQRNEAPPSYRYSQMPGNYTAFSPAMRRTAY